MKRKRHIKFKVRTVLGVLIMVVGFAIAGYMGIWEMFIGPIIDACKHFDAGTLTGLMVGKTIIKCVFASTVSSLIAWASYFAGMSIII